MNIENYIHKGVIMKNKKKQYISKKILYMYITMESFIGGLLTVLMIISFIEKKYVIVVGISYIIFIIISYISYKYVYVPYKENSKVLKLFAKGYTIQGIFDQNTFLSPEIEELTKKFKEVIQGKELITASKKQAEYLALQNQINPHFLYNTLEGIRGETLSAGLDSVAKMTEALETFFRYTISNVENLVSLEDELCNIENYYIIQQYRFGERVNLKIDINREDEEKILKYKIPKLTLQPIVENAIYHGIEKKITNGNIIIKIEATKNRMIITISDDGSGIEEDLLKKLNKKLNIISFDNININNRKKGGIALVNVNRRIKLLFGEEYGILIYSRVNAGTDVEITLPLIEGF